LVYFRQRLIEHAKADVAMPAVLAALQKEGLIAKRSKQRLDSTQVLSAVSDLSALECVRATLRLALEELGRGLAKSERPDFWELFRERYIESQLDYKSGVGCSKTSMAKLVRIACACSSGLNRWPRNYAMASRWSYCAKFSLRSI
jgi:hypothetical protein